MSWLRTRYVSHERARKQGARVSLSILQILFLFKTPMLVPVAVQWCLGMMCMCLSAQNGDSFGGTWFPETKLVAQRDEVISKWSATGHGVTVVTRLAQRETWGRCFQSYH